LERLGLEKNIITLDVRGIPLLPFDSMFLNFVSAGWYLKH